MQGDFYLFIIGLLSEECRLAFGNFLQPIVEMEEQICGTTGEAFNTIHGDDKLRLNQPTAYTSFYSTNDNFVFQYVTMSVNNRDGSLYGVVGTFANVIEWISEAEAEKLKEQGY